VAEQVEVAAEQAPTGPMIHRAMLAAMQAIGAVAKSDRNQAQGFNFRGIDSVLNVVGPALRDAGIYVLPEVERLDYEPVTTEARGKTQHSVQVRAAVAYSFVALDGSVAVARVVGEAIDYGDKGVAKAMSVAYRIALLQVFAIPTDDTEPDAETYTRAGLQRGRGPSPDQEQWADRTPPPAPVPYQGTDDDFAVDVANLESLGDIDALRDLWRQVKAAGRDDQADVVSRVVSELRTKTERGDG
jgi:hypothetical protein